jgi:polar amino acid transport system permease protein
VKVETVETFFLWLYQSHGIDLTIGYDAWDRTQFLNGLWMTIKLSVLSIFFSLIVGVVGAWAQGSPIRVLRLSIGMFVTFFRNTPPLVQLYFFYFALGSALQITTDAGVTKPMLSGFACAIISLSLFAGALNTEIFRSGIEAVPRSTIEAAESLGFSRLMIYFYIVLPLAIRISLPSLGTNLVNLVKTTTLAYAIAVPDLLYAAAQIWSEQLNVREMMTVLLFTYILLVAVLTWLLGRWEKSLRIPGYGG